MYMRLKEELETPDRGGRYVCGASPIAQISVRERPYTQISVAP